MRRFRPLPTALAAVLFLVASNALLLALMPEPPEPTPEDDLWLVYFALRLAPEPPADLDAAALRDLLAGLDGSAVDVADRVTIVDYRVSEWGATAEARHAAGSRLYRISHDGVY